VATQVVERALDHVFETLLILAPTRTLLRSPLSGTAALATELLLEAGEFARRLR
jgi:hypothetical protein